MPSFDIVSEADAHEVTNAYDQCAREITQRYDFQGTAAKIDRTDAGFKIEANSEDRVKAVAVVLEDKFLKRKLSLKFLEKKDPAPAGGQMWSQEVVLKKGVDKENAKKIVGIIKDDKSLKVTPAIQGDAVRVTGKKRDDLQAVMAMLRGKELDLHLSFNNFRD